MATAITSTVHRGRAFLAFTWRVLGAFRANQGLLLAGGVAYYALLSMVPLFTLWLIALTHLVEEAQLLQILRDYLDLILPDRSEQVVSQVAAALENRDVVGWVGLGVLLFFSSLAFTTLENAISVIFYHRVAISRRHFLVSAILPFIYIFALGVGVLCLTLLGGVLQTFEAKDLLFLGWTIDLDGLAGWGVYGLGFVGLVILLTSLYVVMPVGSFRWRHALLGGFTAAVLWEIVRQFLIWYFTNLSIVNVVYGSFATVVVILLSLEIGTIIVLLGAQVIAEYERTGPLPVMALDGSELRAGEGTGDPPSAARVDR